MFTNLFEVEEAVLVDVRSEEEDQTLPIHLALHDNVMSARDVFHMVVIDGCNTACDKTTLEKNGIENIIKGSLSI